MQSLTEKINTLLAELEQFLKEIVAQPEISVHEIRKLTKYLRALLKLDPGFSPELKTKLKTMSGLIAPYRDAQVNMETYLNLLASEGLNKDQHVDSLLHQDPYYANPQPESLAVHSLHQLLEDFRVQFENHISEASRESISISIANSFEVGHRAWLRAQENQDSEIVHTWRKKTKKLWYQLRLIFGDELEDLQHPLMLSSTLGKLLGEIHDLDMLSELLSKANSSDLHAAIKQRRHDLMTDALDRGDHFFRRLKPNFDQLLK